MLKVFRVVTERDGETTKESGERSTEIIRSEYRYAADAIGQVWEAAMTLPDDEQVVAIYEEHPAITLLAL